MKRIVSFILVLCLLLSLCAFVGEGGETDTSTRKITVNYVYKSNNGMVAQPYSAEVSATEPFVKTIAIPVIINYTPTVDEDGLPQGVTLDATNGLLEFNLPAGTDDVDIVLYYVAGQAKYTVIHRYQNLEDDEYTEDPPVTVTGDIDAYTNAVANNKEGFTCTGIQQSIIAADGTTQVVISYDRNYYTVVFDVNGGIGGPDPIYAKYGTTYTVADITAPTRAGYNFTGWADEEGNTPDGIVTHDVTYKAQWVAPNDKADVTYVIWGQNANDNEYSYIESLAGEGIVGDTISWITLTCVLPEHTHIDKCYEFTCTREEHTAHTADCLICGYEEHTTHTKECYADVGDAARLQNIFYGDPKIDGIIVSKSVFGKFIYISGTWYYYNGSLNAGETATPICHRHSDSCYKDELHEHGADCYTITCGYTEHTHGEGCYTTIDYTYDPNLWVFDHATEARVEPDGSTVVDVYFNRVEKTLTFNYNYSNNRYNKTETITARWGADISKEYIAIQTNAGGSFWTDKQNGNGPYTNYFGVMPQASATYYNRGTSGRNGEMTYYGQDLNGQYQVMFTVGGVGGYDVTDEDRYEFEGFTYDHGTANGSDCDGAKFYYTRNKYDLIFYSATNSTPDKTNTPLYQEPLGSYDYAPTNRPATVESDAYFAGWYQNPERTGEEFILSEHQMPSSNLVLYAKWVNRSYTVKTYTDDSLTELYTYEGYDGSQDVEKYKLGVEPNDPPAPDGKVFVGWFYKDETTGEEKAFSFTMPITKDYNLYPKYSEKVMVNYTVHYYINGTETKLADDVVKSALIGTTVTERAKMGDELTYANGEKYFPMLTSTSVRLSQADMEIIFYYTEAQSMTYTVKYQDENGNDLLDPVEKTTDNSIVTETYEPIEGYTPRMYQQTLELSGEAEKNVIIFIYDANTTWLKITKSGEDTMEEGQSFIFHVVGDDEKTKDIDLYVTIQGYGSTTINELPLGSYTVSEVTDWSWRYTPEAESETFNLQSVGHESVFENRLTKDKWLSGSSFAVNTWTETGIDVVSESE